MRDNYPVSPPSDTDPAYISITPDTKKAHLIMADDMVPSLSENPGKIPGAFRRNRSPPRNEHGQMYCDHVNCRGKNQTFKRVCEWNKHMDRHERPYKCREAGCELNPGFTYSGGLLRHQREVHKMHLSTKQPLFCPFPNCNRSSGTGFTRKENLEEHKRRRHLEELSDHGAGDAASQPPVATSSAISQEPPAKRRRISSASEAQGHQQLGSIVAHWHGQHGRKRREPIDPTSPGRDPAEGRIHSTASHRDSSPSKPTAVIATSSNLSHAKSDAGGWRWVNLNHCLVDWR